MTFKPNGANRRVNRAWQMPRNYAEMVQRRKAMQAWAQLSYGFMGRSPDHLASSVIGQVMGIEVFEKHGPARAKALRDYYEEASRNDWFLTYVIINPQAERGKDWGEQAEDLVARIVDEDAGGITIRGAKMLGTSSIMANEVFVANLQPLKARRGGARLLLRAADERQGPARALAQVLRGRRRLGVRQSDLVALRRERRADLFRRREGAVGARVRAPRPRHVPRPVPRHAGPRLPELPGADPPLGEDQVPRAGSRTASPRRSAPPPCRRCASSSASSPRRSAWSTP